MIIAISPATRKKPNDVIRYRCPMILWSVVDSQSARTEPLRGLRGGVTGRVVGCSSVVTERSLLHCSALLAARHCSALLAGRRWSALLAVRRPTAGTARG